MRITKVGTYCITVEWISPHVQCGNVLHYNVTILNSTYNHSKKINALNATFSALKPNSEYDILVAAINMAGTGVTSMINVTTANVTTLSTLQTKTERPKSKTTPVTAMINLNAQYY